jgi:hypothetical protein
MTEAECHAGNPTFLAKSAYVTGQEKEMTLSLLTTWEMSLPLLGVGEEVAELEKVITLFAFFSPINISERQTIYLGGLSVDGQGVT